MNYKGTKRGLKAKAHYECVRYGRITDETREDLYEAFSTAEAEKIIANYEDGSLWSRVVAPNITRREKEDLDRRTASAWAPAPQPVKRKSSILASCVMALVWVLSKIGEKK